MNQNISTSKQFTVKSENAILASDITPAEANPGILILHGAGQSNRKRFEYLRNPLAKDGIATCAFDCIGHGDTGGDITSTSLKNRTEQAAAVIEGVKLLQPLGLLGSSMGAYTAIKLTELYSVDRLVLVVPAIYRKDIYDLPFGEEFSNKIRESESWKDTDVWDILSHYKGKILIAAAENDEVVDSKIPQQIYEAASQAQERKLYIFKGAGHQIREFLLDPDNKSIFREYYQLVRQILDK